jgi:hypothetical protein
LAWRERNVAAGRAPFAIPRDLEPFLLSALGIFSIFAGFFLLDSRTPFPGAAALLPVLGAALIIYAGPLASPSRLLLSNPAAVFIGKISYPLYLWHWPLLAFVYIVNIEKPEPPVRVALILLAFLLATATWLLLEPPIRKRHNNGRTAIVLLVVMAAIGTFGWVIALSGGFEGRQVNRINGGAVMRASGIDNPPLPVRDCTVPEAVSKLFRNCIEQHGEPAHFILLGDSKADALYRGLMAASLAGGRRLYLGGADATTFGAPEPLISDNPAWSHLQPQSRAAIDYITENKDIRVVLYAVSVRNMYQLDDKGGAARLFNTYDHRYLAKLRNNPLAASAQAAVIKSVGRLVASGKTVALLVDNPPLPPLRNATGA